MIERFLREIRGEGLVPRPGIAPADADSVESRFGVRLPGDLRRFYVRAEGMQPGDWALRTFVRILPLDELRPVRECFPLRGAAAEGPAEGLVFADRALSAEFYAIEPETARSPGGAVRLVGPGARIVAGSFCDFLRLALDDALDDVAQDGGVR